jgi:hypothetical protein
VRTGSLAGAIPQSFLVVAALRIVALRIGFVEDIDELGGIEDLATHLALDELGVFLSGDDTNLGMFARGWHRR